MNERSVSVPTDGLLITVTTSPLKTEGHKENIYNISYNLLLY